MPSAHADVLVIGACVAGLTAALSVTGRCVKILCPALPPDESASGLAQGGIAAAVAADDSPYLHALDTLRAGAGLCHRAVVQLLCSEAIHAVRWLEDLGVRFDREDGKRALHREAAHQRARVLHIGGDSTGAALTVTLFQAARALPNIEFLPGCTAVSLRVDDGHVTGVTAVDTQGQSFTIEACDVVLATGGLGQLFCHTTNPRAACGDGVAMALAAGARCANLEFVQFHPTAFACKADPLPLITEALRGAGAVLINDCSERFMMAMHPAAELAPRDAVARGVWRELRAGRRVYLDARRVLLEKSQCFPSIRALCARYGLDASREPIPVLPAAHYHMGGVAVDDGGRTSLGQLWACGEVACTGAHGANRLASNSLLEAVVFGRRVGAALSSRSRSNMRWLRTTRCERVETEFAVDECVWRDLRRLMWNCLGIERDAQTLRAGLARLETMGRKIPVEQGLLRRRVNLARVMLQAALRRRASVGAHYRSDRATVRPLSKRRSTLSQVSGQCSAERSSAVGQTQ